MIKYKLGVQNKKLCLADYLNNTRQNQIKVHKKKKKEKKEAYFIFVKFHQDMEKSNNIHVRFLLEKYDPGWVFLKGMGQAEGTFRNKT